MIGQSRYQTSWSSGSERGKIFRQRCVTINSRASRRGNVCSCGRWVMRMFVRERRDYLSEEKEWTMNDSTYIYGKCGPQQDVSDSPKFLPMTDSFDLKSRPEVKFTVKFSRFQLSLVWYVRYCNKQFVNVRKPPWEASEPAALSRFLLIPICKGAPATLRRKFIRPTFPILWLSLRLFEILFLLDYFLILAGTVLTLGVSINSRWPHFFGSQISTCQDHGSKKHTAASCL